MDTNGRPDLLSLLHSIRGLPCWYVSTGGAAGSTFQLALGGKVLRQVPLRNAAHPEEYRKFEGEVSLLVWCAWRLDSVDAPLTSWDDAEAGVANGLGKLVGRVVESAEAAPPAWDLTVRFSGDLTLHLFCDHVPGDPSFDGNYDLRRDDVIVAVGPGPRLCIEQRSESVVRSSE